MAKPRSRLRHGRRGRLLLYNSLDPQTSADLGRTMVATHASGLKTPSRRLWRFAPDGRGVATTRKSGRAGDLRRRSSARRAGTARGASASVHSRGVFLCGGPTAGLY